MNRGRLRRTEPLRCSAALVPTRGLGTRTFAYGADIASAPGEYTPGTPRGRWLMAHELAHVAQQPAPLALGAPPGPAHPEGFAATRAITDALRLHALQRAAAGDLAP